jgi:hypothetical protein
MGIFTDLFSSQPAQDAAALKAQGYATANTTANAALTAGQAQAAPLYGQAYGNFATLGNKFGAGQDAYNDATGVNGADGITRATNNFKSLPGYQGGLDTGINQLERRAAARGDVGGGNTAADTIKFASDYDAGKYGSYISSLAPNLAGATSATAGGAGVLGQQAAADQNIGSQIASNDYSSSVGQGNAQADAALAPYSASQNFWGALLGGANLALKASGVGGFAPTPTRAAS